MTSKAGIELQEDLETCYQETITIPIIFFHTFIHFLKEKEKLSPSS